MIKEQIVLDFDPEKTDNPTIRAIFQDSIARNIWLGVKQGHIVNQYFNDGCLDIANWGRHHKEPITVSQLNSFLLHNDMIGWAEDDFPAELLPFVLGERTIKWEVKHVESSG